jgi:hypothetical protein
MFEAFVIDAFLVRPVYVCELEEVLKPKYSSIYALTSSEGRLVLLVLWCR